MSEQQNQDTAKNIANDDTNVEALAIVTYFDMTDLQDVSTFATPPSPQHVLMSSSSKKNNAEVAVSLS